MIPIESNMESDSKKFKTSKNPDVDTSFLPDREREEEENKLRHHYYQPSVASRQCSLFII